MFPKFEAHSLTVKILPQWKNAPAAQNENIKTGCGDGNNTQLVETSEDL
jgi:hypothetical protein